MTTSGKELFIRFTARAFLKLLSIFVFSYFPFGFEGRMWDLIVSVPDHCLSFYLELLKNAKCTWSANLINHLLNISMKRKTDSIYNTVRRMATEERE